MRFRPCHIVGTQLEESYEWRMTEGGLTYRDRQRLHVQCPECVLNMAVGFLVVHQQMQHGIGLGDQWETPSWENRRCVDFSKCGGIAGLPSQGV